MAKSLAAVGRCGVQLLAWLCAVCSLPAPFAAPATAATYYVNQAAPSCPTNGTGTLLSPYCTISAAVAAHHEPGDVVLVQGGTYREQVDIIAAGQPGNPFVLMAEPSATIDVSRDHSQFTLGDWEWSGTGEVFWIQLLAPIADTTIFSAFHGSSRLLHERVGPPEALDPGEFAYVVSGGIAYFYVNVGAPGWPTESGDISFVYDRYCIHVSNSSYVNIDNFAVRRASRYGIRLKNSNHCAVSNCVATQAKNHGIFNDDVDAAPATYHAIRYSTVSGNMLDGIRLNFGFGDTITHCTAADNGRDGLRIQNGESEVVQQSTGTANLGIGILITASSTVLVHDNSVADNDHGISVEFGGSLTISDNLILPNRQSGIAVKDVTTAAVTSNECLGPQENGVWVRNGSGIVVSNNIVTGAGFDGIFVDNSPAVVVIDNVVSENIGQGIIVKGGQGHVIRRNESFGNREHGIYLNQVSQSSVIDNHSHHNEHPDPERHGTNGIRVGASGFTNQGDNLVEGNRAHNNEDTGIEVNSSNNNICRRNVSFLNHDHGFDNLNSIGTRFLNNVATRNSGSGVSIESPSQDITVANCLLVENGIDALRRTAGNAAIGYRGYNLEVHHGTTGITTSSFASRYNVIWSPPENGQPEPVVDWGGVHYSQRILYTSVSQFRSEQPGRDVSSDQENPIFVDSLGNCRVEVGSPAIDNADASVAGWSMADPGGGFPWDDPDEPNTGLPPAANGGITFADKGAYEHSRPLGCPMIDTWATEGWKEENSVLRRSTGAELAPDIYRLKNVPAIANARLRIRIRENEQEFTRLDGVRLLVVDHDPNTKAYPFRDRVMIGTREPLVRATTKSGELITKLLDATGGSGFVGQAGETLLVKLVQAAGTAEVMNVTESNDLDPFEIDPGGKGGEGGGGQGAEQLSAKDPAARDQAIIGSTGILIQGLNEDGVWRTARTLNPRAYFDEFLVDTLDQGPLRVVFVGRHRLRYIGRILPIRTELPQILNLLSARHSRLGSALGEVAAEDDVIVPLTPGDTVTFEFTATAVPAGKERSYFLALRGGYSSSRGALSESDQSPAAMLPARFALSQSQPNPVSAGGARFTLELPSRERVRLEVFDPQGRKVGMIVDREYDAGSWTVSWDAQSSRHQILSPGIYHIRMVAGTFRRTQKVALVP